MHGRFRNMLPGQRAGIRLMIRSPGHLYQEKEILLTEATKAEPTGQSRILLGDLMVEEVRLKNKRAYF
jgi:hypothetical protein